MLHVVLSARRCPLAFVLFVLSVLSVTSVGCVRPRASHGPPPQQGAKRKVRPARHRARALADDLPGGITCLLRLRQLGISHRFLASMEQVVTPVEIDGAVGGVRYRAMGRHRLIADCRMVLALHRAGSLLSQLGVDEVHFSSAYSRRPSRRGLRSRHALGLAIDVHRVQIDGVLYRVSRDFERDAGASCDDAPTRLNELACRLMQQRLFDRVLTPDTDAAHHNHFHLAILALDRRRNPARQLPPPIITH